MLSLKLAQFVKLVISPFSLHIRSGPSVQSSLPRPRPPPESAAASPAAAAAAAAAAARLEEEERQRLRLTGKEMPIRGGEVENFTLFLSKIYRYMMHDLTTLSTSHPKKYFFIHLFRVGFRS